MPPFCNGDCQLSAHATAADTTNAKSYKLSSPDTLTLEGTPTHAHRPHADIPPSHTAHGPLYPHSAVPASRSKAECAQGWSRALTTCRLQHARATCSLCPQRARPPQPPHSSFVRLSGRPQTATREKEDTASHYAHQCTPRDRCIPNMHKRAKGVARPYSSGGISTTQQLMQQMQSHPLSGGGATDPLARPQPLGSLRIATTLSRQNRSTQAATPAPLQPIRTPPSATW